MKIHAICWSVIVTALMMIGCSSSSNDESGNNNSNPQGSISENAGFWVASEGMDNEEQNVFYALNKYRWNGDLI